MSIPMTTGPTLADIVTWRWERSRNRWAATLQDGSELAVTLGRRKKFKFWNPSINGLVLPGAHVYADPEAAQRAALKAWEDTGSTKNIYSRDGASKLYDDYLAQAHELCTKYLHCSTLFADAKHSPIEQAVAKALVSAFHRGKAGRR